MIFVPSLTIGAGIGAGLVLPAILAMLSHGPWKVTAPGRRFVLAALLTCGGWAGFLALQPSVSLADLLASAMILFTALLVIFSFWCLLAWGFTVSLLMALARAGHPLSFAEWVAAYNGGGNVETFTRDRLSLLLKYKMARLDGPNVRIIPGRGVLLVHLIVLLRRLFGVKA